MNLNGRIAELPKEVKLLIGAFLIVLSAGYFTGFRFVNETTENNPKGIQENYLGNEDDLEAEVMKFKKPKREMLTIIHTHILSMAVIFFILGGLVSLINLKSGIKKALMIEPLFSVLLTFGGIYLMWLGWHFMRYIVMLSGILMTTSFIISVIIVFFQLFKKKTGKN
ncbi:MULTISPECIES: hypothetical protein [Mesonia]|uniref:Uncharacterized protein n=1 Tax=Mesonia oceanica TaxID=2687242 RepID=A0AC61YA57_9FLAO|nr:MULTISPECIES: hypothetical protein [Mesonia]MAN26710.1 hypothetical protein [Mesonia sp.]MAQ39828.1 hypothetical protein [Mesonia sp.]MBJ96686.1 hypothetical protein [Flavobacteriaceae bacterium]VVV01384.1 hypothetical protein FVB9532_02674 [Mesonia oceanica]|tara:strand:- start:1070 stop:1570 length:501 start_codon:yes stop_codon:yes gene_type:complete